MILLTLMVYVIWIYWMILCDVDGYVLMNLIWMDRYVCECI